MTVHVCAACGYRVEGDTPVKCGRCGHTEWQPLLDLGVNDRRFLKSIRIDPEQ